MITGLCLAEYHLTSRDLTVFLKLELKTVELRIFTSFSVNNFSSSSYPDCPKDENFSFPISQIPQPEKDWPCPQPRQAGGQKG
jgi:hypothetical protein